MKITPVYLSTPKMAATIGRSADWLKARMGTSFKEGVHYFKKPGERDPFWKVEAVLKWVEDETGDDAADAVLAKMVS